MNMQHNEVLQSRVSVVEFKYVFPCLIAENDLSPTALVADMTSNSFLRVEISLNSILREM